MDVPLFDLLQMDISTLLIFLSMLTIILWFDPILVWHVTSNVGDSLNDLIFVIFSLFKRQGLVAQLLRILT